MNKYDWGTFTGVMNNYDYKEKDGNKISYVNQFLNRTLTMFEYDGLPETILGEKLEQILQTKGLAVILEHKDELYVVPATRTGEPDVYGEPKDLMVNNTFLNINRVLTDSDKYVEIKSDFLEMGLLPLYSRFSSVMVETDITLIMSLINFRMPHIISANDDNTMLSAKKFLENIEKGELGAIMESKLVDSLKSHRTSEETSTKIAALINLNQYLKATLSNEIGLNANVNMKKERLITDEVDMLSDNIFPFVDNMMRCREKFVEQMNELFGLDVTVKFGSSWDRTVEEDIQEEFTQDEPNLLVGGEDGIIEESEYDEITEEFLDEVEDAIVEQLEIWEDEEDKG